MALNHNVFGIGRSRLLLLALIVLGVLLAVISSVRFQAPELLGQKKVLTDFDAFHLAGRLALEGRVSEAYHAMSMFAAQIELAGVASFMPWTYPPPFTLAMQGLAGLPIGVAFLLFATGSFAFYIWVLRRIAGPWLPGVVMAVAPAILLNLRTGQNGLLIAGLIGAFLLAFRDNRRLAGLPLGLLIIKPHLAVAVGLLVLLHRRWSVAVIAGVVGLDTMTGLPRFTMGIPDLLDGIGIAPLAMGLFGISEILLNVERTIKQGVVVTQVRNLLPNREDWRQSFMPIMRGSFSGFLLGILPGGGAVLASFIAYGTEKRLSKTPEQFGHGAIAGVAAPEAANNSAAQAAFIPLLTLGIPANAVMGILLGALMIHGITPGPMMIEKNPELFWGTVTSMYLGNMMLLVLNLPLIGLWVRLLRVRYAVLFPLILFIALIGAYVINGSEMDLYLMLFFGVVGYLMRKFEYEPAPLILAYVLSPILEDSLRQSLIISGGSMGIFLSRPISAGFLVVSAILLLSAIIPGIRRRRNILVATADDNA